MQSSKYEKPSLRELVTEQEAVQAGKERGRLLGEYNAYIFPGQFERPSRSCRVTDFLRPLCLNDEISLEGILKGVSAANGRPAYWVDMRSGYGLPQRQIAANPGKYGNVRTTQVDLLGTSLESLAAERLSELEDLEPGITSREAAPFVMRANVETVELPEPADIVTMIEGIQYLDDPLVALSNGYNQLSDGGLLIVAAQHKWPGRIHYAGPYNWGETPVVHLLRALESAEIAFAATDEADYENGFRPRLYRDDLRTLVVQKRPNTQLVVKMPVEKLHVNREDYKRVYYQEPGFDSQPIIEVIFNEHLEAEPELLARYILNNEVSIS